MASRIIAFTYSADHLCDECLTKKLNPSGRTDSCPAWFNSLDNEGNPVGAIYDDMEWWEPSITDKIQYLACGDCEEILDTHTPMELYDGARDPSYEGGW